MYTSLTSCTSLWYHEYVSIFESVFGIVCIFPAISMISNRAVTKGKIATDGMVLSILPTYTLTKELTKKLIHKYHESNCNICVVQLD